MRRHSKLKGIILISLIVVALIAGAFELIYEYFIWNKSIVPNWMLATVAISGYVSMAILIVIFLIQEKKKK